MARRRQTERPPDLGTITSPTTGTGRPRRRPAIGVEEIRDESGRVLDAFVGPVLAERAAGLGPGVEQLAASRFYRDGDEWKPVNTPQAVPTLQERLVAAGLLSEDKVRFGFWDESSATAYRNVLEVANRYGVSASEALQAMSQSPSIGQLRSRGGGGRGGGGGGGRTIALANPQDLRAVANEVAPQAIGRRFTEAEMGEFIGSFHSAQRSGGSPPGVDVAAEAFATSKDPAAAEGRDMVGVFEVALQMMGGGGGG